MKTLQLSDAQAFWLELILESTVAAARPHKGTKSYVAILRKLRTLRERPPL
jgi:hypothetical protein